MGFASGFRVLDLRAGAAALALIGATVLTSFYWAVHQVFLSLPLPLSNQPMSGSLRPPWGLLHISFQL